MFKFLKYIYIFNNSTQQGYPHLINLYVSYNQKMLQQEKQTYTKPNPNALSKLFQSRKQRILSVNDQVPIRTPLHHQIHFQDAKKLNLSKLFDTQQISLPHQALKSYPITIPLPTSSALAGGSQLPKLPNYHSQQNSPLQSPTPVDLQGSVFVNENNPQQFYIAGAQASNKYRSVGLTNRSNLSVSYSRKEQIKEQEHEDLSKSFRNIDSTRQQQHSPTRRVLNPDQTKIPAELMAVGVDPLNRDHTFSLQASTGRKLFQSVFVSEINHPHLERLPPVCDRFSRTLAAPLNGISRSLSGNIGSNYSIQVKRLQLDPTSKQLVFLKDEPINNQKQKSMKKSKLDMQTHLGQQQLPAVASEKQELLFAIYGIRAKELQHLVQEKAKQYEKYVYYVTLGIPDDQIAPINAAWIRKIVAYIKQSRYVDLQQSIIKIQIDTMMQEVIDLYYFYVKSSILDYLLMDPVEQQRLGLRQLTYRAQWGQAVNDYRQVTIDGMKSLTDNKQLLQSTLLCYQQSSIQILKQWNSLVLCKPIINLQRDRIIPMSVKEFCSLQHTMIAQGRHNLNHSWVQSVRQIYDHYLQSMTHTLGPLGDFNQRFYRNSAALLNVLLRDYITSNVADYRSYINQWKTQCLQQLITVRVVEYISHAEAHIDFEDTAHSMRDQIMKVIEEIIAVSAKLLRPESLNTKGELYLQRLYVNETVFSEIHSETNSIIEGNIEKAIHVLPVFEKYSFLFKEPDRVIMQITGKSQQQIQEQPVLWLDSLHTLLSQKQIVFSQATLPSRKALKEDIQKYQQLWSEVKEVVPFEIKTNMIIVLGSEVKLQLLKTCEVIVELYVQGLFEYLVRKNSSILAESAKLIESISVNVDDTAKLVELESIIDRVIKLDYNRLTKEYKELVMWLIFIYDYQIKVSAEDLKQFYNTSLIVKSMLDRGKTEQERIKVERDRFEKILRQRKEEFLVSIKNLQIAIDGLKNFTSVFMSKDANDYIDQILDQNQEIRNELIIINDEEELLGLDQSTYPVMEQCKTVIRLYEDMWRLVRRYQFNMGAWQREQAVFKLDARLLENESQQMLGMAQHLYETFSRDEESRRDLKKKSNQFEPVTVVGDLLNNIQDFMRQIPLVHCLSTPGMKDRHWEKVSILFGFPISSDKEITLKRLIELEVILKIRQLEQITRNAQEEHNFDQNLLAVTDRWRDNKITLLEYELVPGTHQESIFDIQELSQLRKQLEESQVSLSAMSQSPFAKQFAQKIQYQEKWIEFTQELLPVLLENQKLFLYIAPLFFQTDAARTIPEGQLKWKDILTKWRHAIKMAQTYPNIIDFTKQRDLLEFMKKSIGTFEYLYKGVHTYLDGRRAKLPRFFLLSESQLISLLSNYQNWDSIVPYLEFLFQGVHNLILDDKLVIGCQTQRGESLHFITPVYINNYMGNPEGLISSIEEVIQESIRGGIQKQSPEFQSVAQIPSITKNKLLQISLANHDLWYTMFIEGAIQSSKLKHLAQKAQQSANDLAHEFRQTERAYSFKELYCLSVILMNECSWRDIVLHLAEVGLKFVHHFEWQNKIRSYYIQDKVQLNISDVSLTYGNEFNDTQNICIITPLTERAYLSLAQACFISSGSLLVGLQGGGRQTTFRDLARRCGRMTIDLLQKDIDERWEQMFKRMAKAVAGNALWLCCDDTLLPEQLGMVSQVALAIANAFAQESETVTLFTQEVQLRKGLGLCVLLQPENRKYLPDYIMQNFRKVAMYVPDWVHIVKISLFCLGMNGITDQTIKILLFLNTKNGEKPLQILRQMFHGILALKVSLVQRINSSTEEYDNEAEKLIHDERGLLLQVLKDIVNNQDLHAQIVKIIHNPMEIAATSVNKNIWD